MSSVGAPRVPILPVTMIDIDHTTNVMTSAEFALINTARRTFYTAASFPLVREGADPTGMVAMIRTGSDAYGTSTPESDLDYTVVVMPDRKNLLGFGKWASWEPGPAEGIDIKALSLAKFVRLAAQGNPNLIEMLFFPEEQFRYLSPLFTPFIQIRHAFLSRATFERFSGYAQGQFQKMEAGKKEGYMGRKRFDVVQNLGYDPKDASHLMRLLYAGRELVTHGTLTPRLGPSHRDVVVAIKNGEWSLDLIKEIAGAYAKENERLFHMPACPLADAPQMGLIESMLIKSHSDALGYYHG